MDTKYHHPLKQLSPADFAIIMATGIVSIAAHNANYVLIANRLFYLNNLLYGIVWLLTLLKLFIYARQLSTDVYSHTSGLSFLSLVDGTNVVAVKYILFDQNYPVAVVFWVVAIEWWVLRT